MKIKEILTSKQRKPLWELKERLEKKERKVTVRK